jgi:hypothetical protein
MSILFNYYKSILLSFAIFSFILALLFLVWSNGLLRLNQLLQKSISTDGLERLLTKTRDMDNSIIRMRKVLGFVAIILALIFIVVYLQY